MSDDKEVVKESKKDEGQVSLAQMLKVLDKDVADSVGRRLKKLSKKKLTTVPLEEHKVAQLERIEAYQEVSKEVGKWDPVVEHMRKARQISFPLDQEPDHLPKAADSLAHITPRNELELDVQKIIEENRAQLKKQKELTQAEERYLKAISSEEAKERHVELQKMRVKLNSFGAKMRKRKAIKSKSYHRLLKQERIKSHVKRVETDDDALMQEIEKLQRLRAQERATLKHKNTGKWAKHAKFRAKYDEEARQLMLEQIGIAGKLLEKPALPDSDSDFTGNDSESDEDADEISEVSANESDEDDETKVKVAATEEPTNPSENHHLIISKELISEQAKKSKSKHDVANKMNMSLADIDNDDDDSDDAEDEEDDEQRRLMREAFAGDDVVADFQKTKDQLVNEEQPKDIDLYLPGWGTWTGPGTRKMSKRKRQKYLIKAKKIIRKDDSLGNVIISEKANDVIRDLQPKQVPRGIRDDKHFKKILTRPVANTFTNPTNQREIVRPRLNIRMGRRIEPIGASALRDGNRAEWK